MADSAALKALYREVILTHAADPCGFNKPIDATHQAEGFNPLCGDQVTIQFSVSDKLITDAAFKDESCAICTASVSLLCRHLPGSDIDAVGQTLNAFQADIAGGNGNQSPGYFQPMLGVAQYPARVACAELPWKTAVKALSQPLRPDE